MKYLGLFLAVSQAAAHPHGGPPPPPPRHGSPMERDAFDKIEEVCQHDVERHCRPPQEAMQDPLLQWMMAPERLSPPMLHPEALAPMDPINIGPLLDHMMDTALRMPVMMMEPEPEPFFFIMIEQSPPQEQPSEEFILDSMVSRLMQQSDCQKKQMMQQQQQEVEDPFHDVIHHIRLKGQHVLEQEDVPEERRRLARRLTEVTPEEMMGRYHQHDHNPWMPRHDQPHHDHHHICPRKHKCLMQARDQNKLVPECSGALTRLEKVQEVERQQREQMDLYMTFFWFYCILFFALFTMILTRKFKSSKGLFLLRLRILQAVYSNPEIKAKVEDEVGAPLGNVPPLPSVALKMLSKEGRDQCRRKHQRFSQMLYAIMAIFTLDAFGFLPESWPLVVMGGCCVFMVFRMVSLCFTKPDVRECKCCCCGGSTFDIENGTVSDAQACCTCCKGSGICAVKCSSCCGPADGKEGTGTCCGGNCSCAKDHGCDGSCGCCGDSKTACTLDYTLLASEDDCKCCCCGATTFDVANGLLTDAQACCMCCKGSGTCSAKCKTCCGKGGKKSGSGSCCGGNCSCAKDNNCDGSCDCCGQSKAEACCGQSKAEVCHGVQIQIV